MSQAQQAFQVEERDPTPEEYARLRAAVGWSEVPHHLSERGLKNSLYSVCVSDESKLVAFGRVVGDGAVYFYIQDIIVLPEYQGQGLGALVMKNVMSFLESRLDQGVFVGLMAAKDVTQFYERFGFSRRPENRPGMYLAGEAVQSIMDARDKRTNQP